HHLPHASDPIHYGRNNHPVHHHLAHLQVHELPRAQLARKRHKLLALLANVLLLIHLVERRLSNFALPPANAWRTTAAESAMGIHYTIEPFPTPGQTVLSPPLRNAPLTVGAGAHVALL
ncbi:hypothetical protein EVJ58_g9860, partial [Rhodofomes roseus]